MCIGKRGWRVDREIVCIEKRGWRVDREKQYLAMADLVQLVELTCKKLTALGHGDTVLDMKIQIGRAVNRKMKRQKLLLFLCHHLFFVSDECYQAQREARQELGINILMN